MTCGEVQLTYAEMSTSRGQLTGGLRALGLGAGDRVAIVGPNCHRYLELYQAVPGAGMTIVPPNPRHSTAELRCAIEDSGATVLFTGVGDHTMRDVVEHVFDLGHDHEALLASAEPVPLPDALPESQLAGLFYTGGTTGASKYFMLTHRNLLASAMHFGRCWPFTPDTRWLVITPMFHAAGTIAVLATVWNAGHHVVLPAFDPVRALDLIEEHASTVTWAVPTMVAAISEEQLARPRDVSSLRYLSHGGSPGATETLRRAHAALLDAEMLHVHVHVHGATETAPIAVLLFQEERLLDTPACGRAASRPSVSRWLSSGPTATDSRRARWAGSSCAAPTSWSGTGGRPDETAAALVDGWYRTGDIGYQDDEGFVSLVDRAKDMIVTGGENVYSTEVQEALYRRLAVLEAAVFGVPDSRWGEAVHAVVVPRTPVGTDELVAHCRSLIASYKVPKRIDLRSQPLPKSAASKVLERELRDPF